MKRLASLTLIAMMVFGMNAFSINAHEESSEVFNFKTGEYELVQPRICLLLWNCNGYMVSRKSI